MGGEPPNIIEDQVTYPIVTALLAAPNVKAVRAQTMFGDSYVFVVFEDGTDLLGALARSRILAADQGRLPLACIPPSGRMRPAQAGSTNMPSWITTTATAWPICAACRTGICAISSRPFRAWPKSRASAASFASTRCNSIPNKLRAYNIPLSTVIDRVRDSTNEVGGRVLELGGAEYMIRGLGYLRSLDDLRNCSCGAPRTARQFWSGISEPSRSGRTSAKAWRNGMAKAKQSAASSSCATA